MGGNNRASFYVNFEFGAYGGGYRGKDAPLVAPSSSKGTHGYFQSGGQMRSTFLMIGKGVRKGHDMGEIDMRSIAPLIAEKLAVELGESPDRAIGENKR